MTSRSSVLAIVLSLSLSLVLCQNSSPCPGVFDYEPRTEENRWYGVLTISSVEDLTGVYLHVFLDRPADLLGNWFGETSTTNNVEFIIKNDKYVLEAGPPINVRFFVRYNTARTIPSVRQIRLNGKIICSSNREVSTKATTPKLHISRPVETTELPSHTSSNNHNNNNKRPGVTSSNGRRPSGSSISHGSSSSSPSRRPTSTEGSVNDSGVSLSNSYTDRPSKPIINEFGVDTDDDESGADFFPGDFSILTTGRPSHRPPQRHESNQEESSCGTVAMSPTALISKGESTTPGQWPWHAALYASKSFQLEYICGGTLISKQYVITAAHCVTKQRTNKPVNRQFLLVYFGKYNLRSFGGAEIQDRGLEEIHVHPKYNYSVLYNDIAVLKLLQPVQITNFVRPCCLWEDDNLDLNQIVEKPGTVVGWGFDENKQLSDTLMQARMPVVPTIKCIYSNREFFSQFTFENNFCAGFRNGTSACNGDSGGGMVFPKSTVNGHTTWQLRGLVSVGVARQGERICDPDQYILFTDVAKYNSWIKGIMHQNSRK